MIVTKSYLFEDIDPVFFDPDLDPPNKACFNCWEEFSMHKKRHSHHTCPKSKQREFCENCGRQGIDVKTCPRCARGYRDFTERGFKGKYVKKMIDVVSESRVNKVKSESGFGGKLEGDQVSSSENREGAFCDIKKGESDDCTYLDTEKLCKQNNCSNFEAFNSKNISSKNNTIDGCSKYSENERRKKVTNEDEAGDSYDGMFVDEDERTENPNSMNKTVQDFLSIMDALKPLTIQSQSIVALEFVKMQRGQMEKKGDVEA